MEKSKRLVAPEIMLKCTRLIAVRTNKSKIVKIQINILELNAFSC